MPFKSHLIQGVFYFERDLYSIYCFQKQKIKMVINKTMVKI